MRSAAAAAAEDALESRLRVEGAGPRGAAADLSGANAWLLSLERSLCDPAGLPQRGWFKHLIYAPLPSYLAETLPGIREALADSDAQVEAVEPNLEDVFVSATAISGDEARRAG